MNIYVYKIEGIFPSECLGIIDNYKSFNFTKSFQGCGKWTLKGNYTKDISSILQTGNLIYLNPRVAGIIQSVDYHTDSDGEMTYTAYGFELKGILGYRIVWDTYSHNIDADSWIYGLVKENTQRQRQLFSTIQENKINTPKLDRQVSYKNLLDAVEDACAAQHTTNKNLLGFEVLCDIDKGFTFTLLEGADRTFTSDNPYLVSRDMDNVSSLVYGETSQNACNIALVAGEGEGTNRKIATAGYMGSSGLYRREGFKDCRNLQSTYEDKDGVQHTLTTEEYMALLRQEANNQLSPMTELSVDAESVIDSDNALDLLGAKITLADKLFNVQVEDYVSEINWIDEQDGSLTTLTIGKGLDAKQIIY